jgi:hypothetical protein
MGFRQIGGISLLTDEVGSGYAGDGTKMTKDPYLVSCKLVKIAQHSRNACHRMPAG